MSLTKTILAFSAFAFLLALTGISRPFDKLESVSSGPGQNEAETIHLASVICGGLKRIRYLMPMIKTAILMSESPLRIHLFSDHESREGIKQIFSTFPDHITKRVKIEHYDVWFPQENNEYFKYLFKRCASQRLFFPNLIRNVEKLLYLDADTIFTARLEKIWSKFNEFEPQHIMGGIGDCKYDDCSFYNKTVGLPERVPSVWSSGMNSGVLFMKLDRLREYDLVDKVTKLATQVKYTNRIMGDQDFINIIFHNESNVLKEFDCSYNYFPNIYCDHLHECDKKDGIKIVHGVNNRFETHHGSLFHMLVHKIIDADLNVDFAHTVKELVGYIDTFNPSDSCKRVKRHIFKDFRKEII